jgi:LPS-assembly protein
VHDTTLQTVKYKNARLELLGVPIAYSPIFSHPDPTLKRKSGFLRPQYGWTTGLGTHIEGGYYHDIAPDKDLTLRVKPTSLAGVLVGGEWRERFVNGEMKINVSTVNSDRKEADGTTSTGRQRGHVFANGRFDLDENWRSGFDLARASDRPYLRLYDVSKENVLVSQVYAERFDGRDYSKISAMNFQDVRLGIRPQQPDIFPMMEHRMIGAPGAFAGGRWQAGVSALGLTRTNNQQDVQRGTVNVGWERSGVTRGGLSTVFNLDGEGDYYGIQNSDAARLNPELETDTAIGRGYAAASLTARYPFVRPNISSQTVIEPMAGISFSPDTNGRNNEIPNEDSIDIQFDSSNLFQQNRFPGIDRQEDGGRVNYGLTTGFYGNDGKYGKAFIGQSYRFSGDVLYPVGSGLEDRVSDVVGQLKIGFSKYLDADYRFQFDNSTLEAKRHEVQAGGGSDALRLNTRYIYTGEVTGTGFTEPRQQVMVDGSYNLTKTWKLQAASLMDLGDQPGLRNASSGVTYADECFTFSLQGSRNVASEISGENETKVLVRLGLKSIGEFSSPQIQLGQKQSR